MIRRSMPLAVLAALAAGCNTGVVAPGGSVTVNVGALPGHDSLPQDDTPKEQPRLLPAESYIRSYLMLFGGLLPAQAQAAARGGDQSQLFDTWNDYLSSLGLPDYRVDIPRGTQTNTLMLATFERLGMALCNRAVEHDLQGALPASQRLIFAFDTPAASLDLKGFAAPLDLLHRTFLGYPLALAPADRAGRFFKLYGDTVAAHATVKGSRLTPAQAGWATVCYALVRHPEFHLY